MVVVGTQTDFNRFQLKMTQTSKKSLLVTTKTIKRIFLQNRIVIFDQELQICDKY